MAHAPATKNDYVRGPSAAEVIAERMIRGTKESAKMLRGSDIEFQAAKEYAQYCKVSFSPCGLVIHPEAPWLGGWGLPRWPCL